MIFTFGHSTLAAADGADLLRRHGIDVLIDIRSHPTSRWEQWWRENLECWVPAAGIRYEWWPSLGGWDERHFGPYAAVMRERDVDLAVYSRGKFPKQRIGRDRGKPDGTSWTNQGLWDYQWFMTIPEFLRGAERLIREYADPLDQNCAIMCCEALWWKCHRSMVSDFLTTRGVDALHVQPKMTVHPGASRLTRYHPDVIKAWEPIAQR
jgi:uncharacterized protein (DUF488 family)